MNMPKFYDDRMSISIVHAVQQHSLDCLTESRQFQSSESKSGVLLMLSLMLLQHQQIQVLGAATESGNFLTGQQLLSAAD